MGLVYLCSCERAHISLSDMVGILRLDPYEITKISGDLQVFDWTRTKEGMLSESLAINSCLLRLRRVICLCHRARRLDTNCHKCFEAYHGKSAAACMREGGKEIMRARRN